MKKDTAKLALEALIDAHEKSIITLEDAEREGSDSEYEAANIAAGDTRRALFSVLTSPQEAAAPAWMPIDTAPTGTIVLLANMNAMEARAWCFVGWMVDGKVCGHRMDEPTHWMPLPAAPGSAA